MTERYLGVRGGIYLLERDGRYFQQFNDGGWQEKWIEEPIDEAEAKRILRRRKRPDDHLLADTNTDRAIVPPGVKPIWETSPASYYRWHRDHDPEPYAGMAAKRLAEYADAG